MVSGEHFGTGTGTRDNGREWKILAGEDDDYVDDQPEQEEAETSSPLDVLAGMRRMMAAQELAKAGKEIRMGFRGSLEELGDKVMAQDEYEEWEDDLAECYEEMQDNTRGMRPELAAKAESEMTDIAFRERKTVSGDVERELVPIEAYAGHFMRERITALREAIESSGDSDANELIAQIEGFYAICLKHSEFLNPKSMNMPDDVYEELRTKAHNDVIKALNGLNDLCRRFDVRPLTLRNFEDTEGANADLHNQEQVDRKKADRGMVELYYSIAFKDLAENVGQPDFDDEFQVVKYFHELGNKED